MKNTNILLLTLLLCAGMNANANKQAVDSLLNVLQTTTHDTTKVKTLNALAKQFIYSEPQKAYEYANKALALAQEAKLEKGMAQSHHTIGHYHYTQSDYPGALDHWLKSLKIKEETGDKRGMAATLGNIGSVYTQQSDYAKALDYFFKSLKINEEIGNKSGMAATHGNIGSVYINQSDYPKALDYYFKSLKIIDEIGNKSGMAINLGNIGNIYINQSDYAKALDYYFKSLKINEELGNKRGMAISLSNIGVVYKEQSDYPRALDYYFKSLKIKEEIGDKIGMAATLGNIGSLYIKTGKYLQAEENLKKALALSDEIREIYFKKDTYSHFSELYTKTGRHKEALEMYKKHVELRDTLNSEENQKAMVQKEMQFEYEKKTAIDSIAHSKQIEIKNAELAKQEAEIKVKRNQQYALFGGLFLVVVFAGFMYNRFRVTRRQKKIIEEQKTAVEQQKGIIEQAHTETQKQKGLIEEQKLKIEEKHKEVTDSINYAERIQSSILTGETVLAKMGTDAFIYFAPKDVVSGDFYWGAETDDYLYIASCDSTGHGVPGAMMSILNIALLSEAIKEKDILSPDEVFNYVRQRLTETVGRDGQQDGFDGILLRKDKNTGKMDYAAANNAPFMVMAGAEHAEGQSFPKDRMPVGPSHHTEPFSLYEIPPLGRPAGALLSPSGGRGASLYLYTDGFADQFGGPKGKKYRYQPFNELLVKLCCLPPIKQEEKLREEFEGWKGGLEQVDDVCIIGVRI